MRESEMESWRVRGDDEEGDGRVSGDEFEKENEV